MNETHTPTYLPTSARVLAILHLCLGFSLILWYVSEPFMGDLFHTKSQMLIYQDVMGLDLHQKEEKMLRNQERFKALNKETQLPIERQYQKLKDSLNTSFKDKFEKILQIFFKKMSHYELIGLLLSVIVPIMLLKRTDGALLAVWFLPLLSLLLLIDNSSKDHQKQVSLYPSEATIINSYLKEPLSSNILTQQEQLLLGWKYYLIQEWTKESPSNQPATFQNQVEQGEFLFNLHQIKEHTFAGLKARSITSLFLYFIWNLFLATFVTYKLSKEKLVLIN